MEQPLEVLAKEVLKQSPDQAKVMLVALALYEIFCIGKKAVEIAKDIKF